MLVDSYQIAEVIHLKKFKTAFLQEPVHSSSWDLFFADEKGRYLHILGYGVVVFVGYETVEKSNLIEFIKKFSENVLASETDLSENFSLYINNNLNKPIFKSNSVTLPRADHDAIRIITLNVAQSAALDYYDALSLQILNACKLYVDELEHFGRVKISKKNLLKFIGKVKNIKNSIIDNLYILDDPNIVWENENLERIHRQLKEIFDISPRFREVDYRLRIVEDNLVLFTELLQHRESSRLEWIIIILILVEVLNVFFSDWIKSIF
jgi:uncharacterized Rmd1/YagE family protein